MDIAGIKINETEDGYNVEAPVYQPNVPDHEFKTHMDIFNDQHNIVCNTTADLTDDEFLKKRAGIEKAMRKMASDFKALAEEMIDLRKTTMEIQTQRDALLDEYMKTKGGLPEEERDL